MTGSSLPSESKPSHWRRRAQSFTLFAAFLIILHFILIVWLDFYEDPLIEPFRMSLWLLFITMLLLFFPRDRQVSSSLTTGDLLLALECAAIVLLLPAYAYGLYLYPGVGVPLLAATVLTLLSIFSPRLRTYRTGPVNVTPFPLWAGIALTCSFLVTDARHSEVPHACERPSYGPGIERIHVPWDFRGAGGGEAFSPRYFYLAVTEQDTLMAVSANDREAGLLFVPLAPPRRALYADLDSCRSGMPFIIGESGRWLTLCGRHHAVDLVHFDPKTARVEVLEKIADSIDGDVRDAVTDARGDVWVLAETAATLFHIDARALKVMPHLAPALGGIGGISIAMAYDERRERLLVTQPLRGAVFSVPIAHPERAEILVQTMPTVWGVATDPQTDRIFIARCLSVAYCTVVALDGESLRHQNSVRLDTAPRVLAVSPRHGLLLVVNGGAAGTVSAIRLSDLKMLHTFDIGGMTHSVTFHPSRPVAYAGSRCGIFELDLSGFSARL